MSAIKIFELAGTPEARGSQYGETLRAEIEVFRQNWRSDIANSSRVSADRFLDTFLDQTDFVPAVKRWAPDLLAEVRGIAAGANIPFRDCFAMQCMDEQWWFAQEFRMRHHCTSLGQFDPTETRTILAQNMDLPFWMDGSQTVIRVHSDDQETLLLAASGMIGLCGVTAGKLGVCVNTLSQLPSACDGLPVAFVIRKLLQYNTVAEVRDLLKSVKHASGQNYLVGDRTEIADFECCAAGVSEVMPMRGMIGHTNHPLACKSGDQSEADHISRDVNSKRRMASLRRHLEKQTKLQPEFITAVLSDQKDASHPIAIGRSSPDRFFTFASVIWDLQELYEATVQFGAPCHAGASLKALRLNPPTTGFRAA